MWANWHTLLFNTILEIYWAAIEATWCPRDISSFFSKTCPRRETATTNETLPLKLHTKNTNSSSKYGHLPLSIEQILLLLSYTNHKKTCQLILKSHLHKAVFHWALSSLSDREKSFFEWHSYFRVQWQLVQEKNGPQTPVFKQMVSGSSNWPKNI